MNFSILLAGVLAAGASVSAQQPQHPFQNSQLPLEERVTDILRAMTLEEKIAVLGTTTAVPRLGIPDAGGSEGLHGLVQRPLGGLGNQKVTPTTQFAQVAGMGQTWDPALIQRAAEIQATEARWVWSHADKNTRGRPPLVIWGPNADLARDPRWGRIDESYGEDAFFNGTMVSAFVKGMQGNDPKYWRAASLMKHFLANSNEHRRYGSNSGFDERLFREYYSLPFRMGFAAGASSYMASYNAWNEIPMTVHPVLESVLAKEWHVDGIVSTDAGSVRNMVTKHHYYEDMPKAVAACVKVGVNQFLDGYRDGLQTALKDGLVTEADLDAALRGKFRTVIRLGLLDAPEKVPYAKSAGTQEPWTTEAHRAVALQVARESIVLLKNADNLLPLDRTKIQSIAIYGPRANEVLTGIYSGEPPYTVSPVEGLKKKLGDSVKLTMGGGFMTDPVAAAKAADVAIVFVGNDPTCNRKSIIAGFGSDDSWCETPSDGMENSDRRSLELEAESTLIQQVAAANRRTIVVLLADFPYAINWTNEHVPAILEMSQNAQEAGTAIADVLFGDYNPAGRTVVTWPKSLEQLPPMLDYNIRHGHTYMYFKGEPLYPFGYGLSYTKFGYSNLRAGKASISVDVTNTGGREGDEVVQMYVRHEGSRVIRPQKELRGFQRVHLAAGATTTVTFALPESALAYWNEARHAWEVERDKVVVSVGGSSVDERAKVTLRWTDEIF